MAKIMKVSVYLKTKQHVISKPKIFLKPCIKLKLIELAFEIH